MFLHKMAFYHNQVTYYNIALWHILKHVTCIIHRSTHAGTNVTGPRPAKIDHLSPKDRHFFIFALP